MSWAMPTAAAAAWNPGMAMTPDMANYTPEQWAALQQQNWQQWTQWQQQYAQWQSTYGEKYTQQMQAMQVMGGMPPLPTGGGAPPAPPPPDKPPPPPPHENNQPLFGNNQNDSGPTPVPPPNQQQPSVNTVYNNTNNSGNNQNWSNASTVPRQGANQGAGNSEALKKLAEEERLFDIQFQKWEEEILKWKKENQNHPDKEAYKEYEAKFEACRVQLLERRQQMKQRRARLLGHPAPPSSNTVPTGNNNNASSNIPPLMQTPIKPPIQTPVKPSPTLNQSQNKQSQNYNSKPPQNYDNQDIAQNQQYKDMSQTGYNNRSINKTVDPQDRYEAYQTMEDYSGDTTGKTSFLPPSTSSKGIPGLDLVPEIEKPVVHDVIDITDDGQPKPMKAPDYSTISKGINNILGDEKIMNILSMVRGQTAPADIMSGPNANEDSYNSQGPNVPPGSGSYTAPGPYTGPSSSSGYTGPGGHTGSFGSTALGQAGPGGHSGPAGPNSYPGPPGPSGQGPPGTPYGHNVNNYNNVPPNNQWDRNDNQYNQQQYNNRPNMPFNRQGPPPQSMQNPQVQNRMYDGNSQEMPQNQYYDRNDQYGSQNIGPPPLMSIPPPGRPSLLDMPGGQQNLNDYRRGPMDNSDMHEGRNRLPDNRLPSNRLPGPGLHEKLPINQPLRPTWVEEPLFTPSIIVEYEHKPLRLKAREFIEPVHMFDYNHKSNKDDEYKRKDFEKEVDELFTRKPRRYEEDLANSGRYSREPGDRFSVDRFPKELIDRFDREPVDRFSREPVERFPRELLERFSRESSDRSIRDPSSRDFERRPREEMRERDEYHSRLPPREEYDERRRPEPVFDRRRDDRDRYNRRDDYRDKERDDHRDRDRDRERDDYRERDRDRFRDSRREEPRLRSRSRDRDLRKRGRSRESEISDHSKRSKDSETKLHEEPRNIIMIDDILESPGREMRPEKIVIILRGPPGSGKSYLAKLIRDREAEYGGAARIMSIDDYFMQEGEIEEKDPNTGKTIKKPTLKYEYDESLEETYTSSLKRAFKRSLTDGYFNFLIYDANNDQLKSYADIWNFSRQNGFQVYICTMELDPQICFKRNIHKRTLEDIQVICSRFFPTPNHHLQLDATTLLQSAAIPEVQMEDAIEEVNMEDVQDTEVENSFTSKWEKMDDAAQLARLDGISKPLRSSQLSMEDYLQLDDWKPNQAKPGKKTVRWADIEERRKQEKMRAIGFVVGQTDWNRMTDPTMGSSALTQTKYIERVRRN